MQSLEQGGLSERAIQRAKELAATSDLRVTAPTRQHITEGATTRTIECAVTPSRTPLPGKLLTRRYKGQLIQVRVLADGYEYLGERYRSLSAIAKQIAPENERNSIEVTTLELNESPMPSISGVERELHI